MHLIATPLQMKVLDEPQGMMLPQRLDEWGEVHCSLDILIYTIVHRRYTINGFCWVFYWGFIIGGGGGYVRK